MFDKLKDIFGIGPVPDFAALIEEGAQIIDVRSREEFRNGHIAGAVNIPLPTLAGNLAKVSKERPVIVCCASGMRSASALGLLKMEGYKKLYNGGGWAVLQAKLKRK